MRPSSLILLLSAMFAALHASDQPVPVVKEPYHKPVFENEYVRMIDVQIPVGVTTWYHIHDIPSVIVYLTKSSNASQTWGAAGTTPRHTTPGDSRYAPYDTTPLTHRVTNTGTNLFRVYDIELLRKPSATPFPPAPTGVKPKWEEKLVRSSNLVLDAGGKTEIKASDCAHVLVGIMGNPAASGGKAGERALKHGEFLFYPPRTAVSLRNSGKDAAEVVLLELK
jgi:hypothetical protein